MSVQARAAVIIEIPDEELPRPNNQHNNHDHDTIDHSVASVQLPDTTDILAGFNAKKAIKFETEAHDTDEVRAFGKAIANFNCARPDSADVKPSVAKAPRKPRMPRAPKEPKVPKVKVARIPKIKAVPKKPLTVTERAIAPFLPKSATKTTLTESSILDFLTPSHIATPTKAVVSKPKVTKRKKSRAKAEELVQLSTPRTARRKHRNQNLVYPELPSSQELGNSNVLNPSKLISLSKGHFSAGNRCPDGRLTEGGPREITSNQEGLRYLENDELLDLTNLPRKCIDTHGLDERLLSSTEPKISYDYSIESESELDTDPRDLQTYLDDLVEGSDTALSDDEFPVTAAATPVNVRSETMDSLRDLLQEQQSPDSADKPVELAAALLSPETNLKRVREVETIQNRAVSPKLGAESTPRSPRVYLIDSDPACDEDHVAHHTGAPSSTMPIAQQYVIDDVPVVDTTVISPSEALNALADFPIIDTEVKCVTEKSAERIVSDATVGATVDKVRKPRGRPRKSVVVAHVELPQSTLLESNRPHKKSADQLNNKSVATTSQQYWEVPDSEDDEPSKVSVHTDPQPIEAVHKSAPNYQGFTTLQLQTELSQFGFKISKNRAGMVDLLHKCWQAKQEQAGQVLTSQSATSSTRPATAPVDQVHKPYIMPVVDLSDLTTTGSLPPQSYMTATKARGVRETSEHKSLRLAEERIQKANLRQQKQKDKAAQKIALAEVKRLQKLADKEANESAKVTEIQSLYRNLTNLLRSEEGHVWWLRILRYEPVVLEDFVEWLQETKAITTDVDTVRDYFDWKGVCCVKRITRAGKGRKRF